LKQKFKPSRIVPKPVISGPHWSMVSALGHYSPSAMSAVDDTNQYRLLTMFTIALMFLKIG